MDKYKALWLSHSSIADFLKCPRAYYLRHVYKDKRTGHKITVTSPALSLGSAVHEVLETISFLPVGERFAKPLSFYLDQVWPKFSGEKGGFGNKEEEAEAHKRALKMLQKVETAPGPLKSKAVKIVSESGLPYYWLSEADNVILSGKIDWIEYLEAENAIHIIDFKTGKSEDTQDSLQLPIYYLLAQNTQPRPVARLSYWFLEGQPSDSEGSIGLVAQEPPDTIKALAEIMEIAKRIKLGRQIDYFKCPTEGCFACRPLERVLAGEGKLVGLSSYRQDIYILPKEGKKKITSSPTDTPFWSHQLALTSKT